MSLQIGLLGYGTVGSAFDRLLLQQQEWIGAEYGFAPNVKIAGVRNTTRPGVRQDLVLTSNLLEVVDDPEVQIVVDAMGGINPAEELTARALHQGKWVISANKAVLSECWSSFAPHKKRIFFEPAVAAAIPCVRTVRDLAAVSDLTQIYGILNGTSNFILTQMATGASYAEALQEAQEMGYAEADPTLDVSGGDAGHKISLLGMLAARSQSPINTEVQGIDKELPECGPGQKVKLIARWSADRCQVRPEAIDSEHPLFDVDGVENAVVIEGPAFGRFVLRGPGAGGEATATGILQDLATILRLI